jgi:hypothetical protein
MAETICTISAPASSVLIPSPTLATSPVIASEDRSHFRTSAIHRSRSSSPEVDGQIEWVMAVIRDVTERYGREKALRAQFSRPGRRAGFPHHVRLRLRSRTRSGPTSTRRRCRRSTVTTLTARSDTASRSASAAKSKRSPGFPIRSTSRRRASSRRTSRCGCRAPVDTPDERLQQEGREPCGCCGPILHFISQRGS